MAGPERWLQRYLPAAVRSVSPAEPYPAGFDTVWADWHFGAWRPPKGSQNWCRMRHAFPLYVGSSRESLRSRAWIDGLIDHDLAALYDYELGREKLPWSVVCYHAYLDRLLRPDMAHEDVLREDLRAILEATHAWLALQATPWSTAPHWSSGRRVGPSVQNCGARSPAWTWEHSPLDDIFGRAIGLETRMPPSQVDEDPGLTRGWEWRLLDGLEHLDEHLSRWIKWLCQRIVQRPALPCVLGQILERLEGFRLLRGWEYHIVRLERGVVTAWQGQNPHSPPALGRIALQGREPVTVAPERKHPTGRWPRYRCLFDPTGEALWQGPDGAIEGRLTWEGERVVYYVKADGDGVRRVAA